ncbi:hypothetical protein ABT131_27350 [Streptomyces sp900105245]
MGHGMAEAAIMGGLLFPPRGRRTGRGAAARPSPIRRRRRRDPVRG